jgi:hypothetical protein
VDKRLNRGATHRLLEKQVRPYHRSGHDICTERVSQLLLEQEEREKPKKPATAPAPPKASKPVAPGNISFEFSGDSTARWRDSYGRSQGVPRRAPQTYHARAPEQN